jgi:cytochrome P450
VPDVTSKQPDGLVATPGEIFVSPAAYADPERWHAVAAELRRTSPVHLVEAPGFRPFYAITRHGDVMAIERRADVFHNTLEVMLQPEAIDAAQRELGPIARSLPTMDGDFHRAHRAATADWFRPTAVRRLTERIVELAETSVDALEPLGGECDFVTDLALQYPLHVIMEILGVPRLDEALMLRLTQELFGANDPDFSRGAEMADTIAVIKDFYRYFGAIAEARRHAPADDLATVIATAVLGGEPMGKLETISYFLLIATAGHDTTSNAIAGGLDVLLDQPDQLERLRAEPELLTNAVDEILRWVSPVKQFMRTAQADIEINGHAFSAGDRVLLSYASANRDETVFADPFRFDVGRSNASDQIAFGFGAHFCLGAHLARLEMRELFRALLQRVAHIERAGPTDYTQTIFVGGPKRLPIRYRMAANSEGI